jgi:hypothetical protein
MATTEVKGSIGHLIATGVALVVVASFFFLLGRYEPSASQTIVKATADIASALPSTLPSSASSDAPPRVPVSSPTPCLPVAKPIPRTTSTAPPPSASVARRPLLTVDSDLLLDRK